MLQSFVHYTLHFLFPGIIAFLFFRNNWKMVWSLFLATMIIDVDHLWANPIFDPQRCSINFHFLHSYYAIGAYVLLLVYKRTRIIGLGLILHILTDGIDCLWMR